MVCAYLGSSYCNTKYELLPRYISLVGACEDQKELVSIILAVLFSAGVAMALPTESEFAGRAIEKRECNRRVCCSSSSYGYFECLDFLCTAFPDSISCPIICSQSCNTC
ncbi:hypothetical protein B0J11DRAFT_503368 [Dendryphion nanum]|uniref:Uncharacterized protein n=1 Tax=Dendryphion nanum TaxID=256645 RepID=A0A9P9E7X2_9PLEO|nr:hypothetical protein B0J11DRAFT_503368 [Dendryphion nanum]